MNLTDFLHHILILESYKAKSCRRGKWKDKEERKREGKMGKGEERKRKYSTWLKWTNTEAVKWTGKATNICWLLILHGADINESLSHAAIYTLLDPNDVQIMYPVQRRGSFAIKEMKTWALLK